MQVSPHSRFSLTVSQRVLDVSRFELINWGISCEYVISLTLRDPFILPALGERAIFEMEGLFFHGVIQSLIESEQGLVIEIASPMTESLQPIQTRVYAESSLKALFRTLLIQAGLFEGVQFELNFPEVVSPLWQFQKKESTVDFFRRLLAEYGLSYHYIQTSDSCICQISDSMASFFSKECRVISQYSHLSSSAHLEENRNLIQVSINHLGVLPGQEVTLIQSECNGITGRVSTLAVSNPSHHNLDVQLVLTTTDARLCPVPPTVWKSFHTATIEQTQENYPEPSSQGEYRIRLADDASAVCPWVRSALYFSGNDSGMSQGLVAGCEVMVGFENGSMRHPILLGALPNQSARSPVNQANPLENVLQTASGSRLGFQGMESNSSVELIGPDQDNQLSWSEGPDFTQMNCISAKGTMVWEAQSTIQVVTKTQWTQQSVKQQQLWAKKKGRIQSIKSDLLMDSEEDTTCHSEQHLDFIANIASFKAKESVQLGIKKGLALKGGRRVFWDSSNSTQVWKIAKGGLVLRARMHLALKAPSASLEVTPVGLVLTTPTLITLEAQAIAGPGI